MSRSLNSCVGPFPQDTAGVIKDQQLSLVHIDVDVYQSAKETFEWAWSRLNIGGAVIFDDYGFERCGGVTKFVNELDFKVLSGAFIHNLNGHAIVIKTCGAERTA